MKSKERIGAGKIAVTLAFNFFKKIKCYVTFEQLSLPYVNISAISAKMAISEGRAVCKVVMPLKNQVDIDSAQITAYIKKGSGTIVKTFSETMSVLITQYSWKNTYKLPSRGKYYLSVVVKCYKSGKVIETITMDSKNVTY